MTQTLSYQQTGTAARGQAHTLFAQTMAYVAATVGLFALGAWLGRDLTGGVGIVADHPQHPGHRQRRGARPGGGGVRGAPEISGS